MYLILPTREILQEYSEANKLFYFYENGLKGIIKDLILHTNIESNTNDKILEKIVREYSTTPEATISRIMENIQSEVYIEAMLEIIANTTTMMMRTLLPRVEHHISAIDIKWYYDDLIIKIQMVE